MKKRTIGMKFFKIMQKIKENLGPFFVLWGIIILLNQFFLFHGCFNPACIVAALPHTGVIAFVLLPFLLKDEKTPKKERSYESPKNPDAENRRLLEDKEEQYRSNSNKADPLKEMGDAYEKEIGKEFESKGDFVIYNGLIRGVADGGVDLIVISHDSQSINLVQCKNWHKMKMEYHHISGVYDKLTDYASNINYAAMFGIYFIKYPVALQEHLHYKKGRDEIANILKAASNYPNIRKTLYIATEQIIDLDVGHHLTMIKPNIFRYKDMKIAITKI